MNQYPLNFKSKSECVSGINSVWNSSVPHSENLILAIPPEFEGQGGGFSPEDLYAMALTNCFVATFKYAASKSNLDFKKLEVESNLIVDLDELKKPIMKELIIHSNLFGPNNPERAKRLLQKIESNCLIINSVKTKVKFHHEIIE